MRVHISHTGSHYIPISSSHAFPISKLNFKSSAVVSLGAHDAHCNAPTTVLATLCVRMAAHNLTWQHMTGRNVLFPN